MKTTEKQKVQTGIWIDGKKATIVTFNNGVETFSEIESGIEDKSHHPGKQGKQGTFMGIHHISDERKFEERKRHQVHKFLDKVIDQVKTSDELFIMGPSELKLHLRSKIEEDHLLSRRLRGVAATDHLTRNQCVAKVKEFYEL